MQLIVRQSFTVGPKTYKRGQRVDSSDPVIEGREDLFEQLEVIERATAGPGEKRMTPPRKKPATAKKAGASKK